MKKILSFALFAMIGCWASAQVVQNANSTDVPLESAYEAIEAVDADLYVNPDVDYKNTDIPIPPPLAIYPNPTANKVTVDTEAQVARIEVRNTQGTKLLTVYNEKSAELMSLPAGTYLFTVILSDNSVYTYTVIRR